MQQINHYSLDKQTENLYRVIQWIMSYPMDSINNNNNNYNYYYYPPFKRLEPGWREIARCECTQPNQNDKIYCTKKFKNQLGIIY